MVDEIRHVAGKMKTEHQQTLHTFNIH